jgi:hypothetical protein
MIEELQALKARDHEQMTKKLIAKRSVQFISRFRRLPPRPFLNSWGVAPGFCTSRRWRFLFE